MITNSKILIRFLILFFTLLIVPFPLDIIPGFEFLKMEMYNFTVPWIGENILGIPNTVQNIPTGSGDRTFDYVLLFFLFTLALVGTLIWSLIDLKERSYEKLNYWFLVLIRYNLGYFMISYGMVKIMPIQFGEIMPTRMVQTIGEFSPMGLAWTFLAYSKGYGLFIGLSEFIGGLLLFHKRTRLLGALVLIPVTINIVAINFFFDVPVKLLSSQLFLMTVILLLPDLRRLFDLIVLNKSTEKAEEYQPFEGKSWVIRINPIKWIFIVFMLYKCVSEAVSINNIKPINTEFFGLYEVTTFTRNGEALNNDDNWKYIYLKYARSVEFELANKSTFKLDPTIDLVNKRIKLTELSPPSESYYMDFDKVENVIELTGIIRNDTIHCKSKKLEAENFRLTSRKYRWINEFPFNR